jgi:uncharacterized protein YbbK (DUF523 family)
MEVEDSHGAGEVGHPTRGRCNGAMRPRVGISACLLGERVRWNGEHRRADELLEDLAREVTFVPVCPEMEIGLGTPREPVHLVRRRGAVRMLGASSGTDHTAATRTWANAWLDACTRTPLHGFILKSRSPSCGLRDVEVTGAAPGSGLFAQALLERFPDLPVEDETTLSDPAARPLFLARVRAYAEARTHRGGAEEGERRDSPRRH